MQARTAVLRVRARPTPATAARASRSYRARADVSLTRRPPHPRAAQSRFLVLLAVVGAVTMGAGMFLKGITTVRKAWLVRSPLAAAQPRPIRAAQQLTAPRHATPQALLAGKSSDMGIKAIESLDEFLTGCASLVFGMVRMNTS